MYILHTHIDATSLEWKNRAFLQTASPSLFCPSRKSFCLDQVTTANKRLLLMYLKGIKAGEERQYLQIPSSAPPPNLYLTALSTSAPPAPNSYTPVKVFRVEEEHSLNWNMQQNSIVFFVFFFKIKLSDWFY